jgi:hypothetical protein
MLRLRQSRSGLIIEPSGTATKLAGFVSLLKNRLIL